MEPTPDHARRIENMMRSGTIAEVDHAHARVRVESGGLKTDWLPWHTGRAGGTRQWSPPTVGEQVLLLSPSGELGAGVAITGFYSDVNASPSISPDEIVTVYPDGAAIAYNHATGALIANGIKSANLTAANTLTITCPSVTFSGNVTIQGNLTAETDVLMLEGLTVTGLAQFNGGTLGDRT